MSFPVNLLSIDEIESELKRRNRLEIDELRSKIAEHRQAIQELQARIELASQAKMYGFVTPKSKP